MTNITVISDTHGLHERLNVPTKGDIIIHAGDCTSMGTEKQIKSFLEWYGGLDYKEAILIPGNHDWGFEKNPEKYKKMCKENVVLLLNNSEYITYKDKIKIWGSPVTPEFFNWAFNRSINPAYNHHSYNTNPYIGLDWNLIPDDIDILLTHAPPRDILDKVTMSTSCNFNQHVGCPILMQKIENMEHKPKMHIFGHIHSQRGVIVDTSNKYPITYVNGSSLDDQYKPRLINYFRFNWDRVKKGTSLGKDNE